MVWGVVVVTRSLHMPDSLLLLCVSISPALRSPWTTGHYDIKPRITFESADNILKLLRLLFARRIGWSGFLRSRA